MTEPGLGVRAVVLAFLAAFAGRVHSTLARQRNGILLTCR